MPAEDGGCGLARKRRKPQSARSVFSQDKPDESIAKTAHTVEQNHTELHGPFHVFSDHTIR